MKKTSVTRRESPVRIRAAGTTPRGLAVPADAARALTRLKQGNARFVSGRLRHAHQAANWRKHLKGSQQPFATILACSDSRCPPSSSSTKGSATCS